MCVENGGAIVIKVGFVFCSTVLLLEIFRCP